MKKRKLPIKKTIEKAKETIEKAKETIEKTNKTSGFILKNRNLLILTGVGVVGYLAYKNIKKSFDAVGTGVSSIFTPAPTDHISGNQKNNPANTTITKQQAVLLAKALHEAFNKMRFAFFWGTDKKKIRRVFEKIKTGDDYKLVYNVFGMRPRTYGGTPTFWLDKVWFSEDKDLNYWLRAEIGKSGELYEMVKKRVESAGYTF